jgi:LacI family transcriptional regulator
VSNKNTVSIKDIARISNVSVSTVSRVLNNTGRYSEETERIVRDVIASLQYTPSPFAKALRTNTSPNIGIIVPDITNEFFASITLAIQKRLFEKSYMTLICNTNEQPSLQEKQLKILQRSKVSGIIFISGEDISRKELISDGIPKVFLDRLPRNAEAKHVVSVTVNNFQGGLAATEELLDSGCKRIAALFDGRGLSTQVDRYSGYLRAHRNRALPVIHELYWPVNQISFQSGYEITMRYIKSGISFDGIFCYTDQLACGAVHALIESGISVPEQVRVIGYDNISASRYCTPTISTIAQPVDEIGTLAADLLLKLQNGDELEQTKHVLPVKLIKRQTTTIE